MVTVINEIPAPQGYLEVYEIIEDGEGGDPELAGHCVGSKFIFLSGQEIEMVGAEIPNVGCLSLERDPYALLVRKKDSGRPVDRTEDVPVPE
ncbi:MAG: hypothetical protein HY459_01410 [Parcubacteria group bacterium]|nr:hypothetical protein [Parcubacteria group bacterium]